MSTPSSVRCRALALGLGLGLLLGGSRGAAADESRAWLQVEEPAEATRIHTVLALVPIKGYAGMGAETGHDVVIALDRSASVWDPSGSDIDGDGQIGRARAGLDLFRDYKEVCTDPDDTIMAAELRAARLLIETFDAKTTRMGLLSFGSGARVHAPVGSSRRRLLHALAEVPREAEFGGTSFENAFKLALLQFQGLGAPEPATRSRTLILLSDGRPTQPSPIEHARRFAVLAAKDLARSGVRIFAFALRPTATDDGVYQQIATVTGGAVYLAERPSDVIEFAPLVPLTKIDHVEIDNVSASKPARAVRLQPDGSFDGFAPLVPGLNLLRVTAVGERGQTRSVDRRVYFDPAETQDPEETARMQDMLKQLQLRTVEAEMAGAAQKRLRKGGARKLDIKVEN